MPSLSVEQRKLLEEVHRRGLRLPRPEPLSFRDFVSKVNPRFRWYRHCEVLVDVLQRVADGKIKRLMVFMPPRHGKSEMISRLFAAYWLYLYPHQWVGLNSYGAELAYTLSRAARGNFAAAGGYLRQDAAAVRHWETLAGGGMWAAGVGGPITGKGWHLGIIDDSLKNAEEAASETIREKQKDWFRSTFATREEPSEDGEPDGALVVTATRWNEDDLPGWLLSEDDDEDGESWHIVSLEAIKEEGPPQIPRNCTLEPDWREPGEALCPERRPLEKLRRILRRIGSYFWAALYQQKPQPDSGHKFKREWFCYWERIDEEPGLIRLRHRDGRRSIVKLSDCRRFGTIDLANSLKKQADWTVLAAWAVTPFGDLVLLDLLRGRLEDPDIPPKGEEFFASNRLDYVIVETNGIGLGVTQTLRRLGVPVRAMDVHQDKLTRSSTAQIRTEAGQVFFPLRAAWLPAYEHELIIFPNGAHDDQVDVTSMAAIDVFHFGEAPEPSEIEEARQAAEQKQKSDDWHSVDNEAWWEVA